LAFFQPYTKRQYRILKFFYLIAIIGLSTVTLFRPTSLDYFYNLEYILFVVTAAVIAKDFYFQNKTDNNRGLAVYKLLTLVFFVLQTFDYFILLGGFNLSYTAPAYLVLLSVTFSYLIYKETIDLQRQYAEASFQVVRTSDLVELATRVAHDIRSPLSVLKLLLSRLKDLPHDERELLATASLRLHEIATDLLKREKRMRSTIKLAELLNLLDSLIKEVQVQFPLRRYINNARCLESDTALESSYLSVNPVELSRSLSNLLVNSVEATREGGEIKLSIGPDADKIAITIEDDGIGIPSDVLPELTLRGATFGKQNGNGLGLYYAKMLAEKAGGNFTITSTRSVGTKVVLAFPLLRTERK
jgi:signal transduction histidine kinase